MRGIQKECLEIPGNYHPPLPSPRSTWRLSTGIKGEERTWGFREGNSNVSGFEMPPTKPTIRRKKLDRRGRGARRERDRNIGVMECWNIGKPIALPPFHYSISFLLLKL